MFESTGRNVFGINLKVMGIPLLFLGVLIALVVIVVNTGFKQVTQVREKLQESKKQEAILTAKLETLQRGEESYQSFSDLSAVAIPDKNPAAIVSSQVKTLGAVSGVAISKVSALSGGNAESGLRGLSVEISVQGELANMIKYFDSLRSFLPLTEVVEVNFTQGGATISTEAQITSFFAPFPEALPSLTAPITDLTQEEKEILAKYASYAQPTFTRAEVVSGGPYERADLFSF